MVITFFFFGYQKWFSYEAETLIPYISNGPLIFWLYPAFGIRGAAWILGGAEWLFGALMFLGFWNKSLGARGALGACIGSLATLTMLAHIPNAWDASAGGFPAARAIGGGSREGHSGLRRHAKCPCAGRLHPVVQEEKSCHPRKRLASLT
ncbi:MAG TPA: DUF417 family protein [Gemmatimonadaceae bacterium]|jgi:uncharacterized membrane protein YkgB|nr:DUF417 family protein [Gemmatimonadaceae bacterium]